MTNQSPLPRIVGYDLARALAILGMVVVHFSIVMAKDWTQPPWLASIVFGFLDGRAAATFVVLAGVGITLMSRRAVESGDPAALAEVRRTLVRRGLFLLAIGFINLMIWPGDILRVYGVSLLLATTLITASNRQLLVVAGSLVLAFLAVFLVLDFEKNWNWETYSYRGLWTPAGIVRNLFYDGFRSVLPWTGFVVFGMWLGRLNLLDRNTNRRVLLAAFCVTVGAELLSKCLVTYVTNPPSEMTTETAIALFGTQSMPALPLFLLAAGGTSVFVIAACVRILDIWPSRVWNPLIAAGQMALTWYFAHIVLGLGTVVALGLESAETLPVASLTGVAFFAGATLVSWLWKCYFRHGPLEWLMRRVSG